MALTIIEAEVEVSADGSKLPAKVGDDIDRNSDGPMSKAGLGMAGKLFAGFLAYEGVQKVAGWVGDAITGGSNLNESINKSTTIFGAASGAIASFAEHAAVNIGLSEAAAYSAASGFGDLFTQIGFTESAAASMAQQVLLASADLGSFSNLETADVAERITAAFRGEYDSLQAVIPNINAARVESEALAASGKTVASELTAQEKATAVLAIVQKDGAKAMGDFARTSDDYANSTKIAQAQLSDLQNEVGTALLPTMTGLMSFVRTDLIPGFQGMASWFGENIELIKSVGLAIGIAAGTFLVLNGAVSIYNGIMTVYRAVTTAGSVAQWALNVAMSANPIGLVITLIALLVGAIVWVATQTTFFQDVWTNVTNAIGTAWTWLWETVLSPVFTAIGTAWDWLYNNVIMPVVIGVMLYIGLWAAAITWLWETAIAPILNLIGLGFNWIYTNVIGPVVDWITGALDVLGLGFRILWANYVQPTLDALGAGFNWVWVNVISPVINAIGSAVTWIGDTIRGVFDGIAGFIGSAFTAALNVVRGPINGIISLVNSAIKGLNSLSVTIPDWVPVVGGQRWGLSIPNIPMLERGGNLQTSGTVLVGERGPEFLSLPRGAQVTPLDRPDALPDGGGGDAPLIGGDLIINEAQDPLGSAGRVGAVLRRYKPA